MRAESSSEMYAHVLTPVPVNGTLTRNGLHRYDKIKRPYQIKADPNVTDRYDLRKRRKKLDAEYMQGEGCVKTEMCASRAAGAPGKEQPPSASPGRNLPCWTLASRTEGK